MGVDADSVTCGKSQKHPALSAKQAAIMHDKKILPQRQKTSLRPTLRVLRWDKSRQKAKIDWCAVQ